MSNFTTSRKQVSDLMALSISEGMLPWRADFNRAGAVPINADTEEPYKLDSAMLLSFFRLLYNYTDNRWISQKQAEKNGLKIPKNAQGFVIDFFSVKDKKSGMYIDFDKYMKNVQEGIIDSRDFQVEMKATTLFNVDFLEQYFPPEELKTFVTTAPRFVRTLRDEHDFKIFNEYDIDEPKERVEALYRVLSNNNLNDPVKMMIADITYSRLSHDIDMNDFGFSYELVNDFKKEWVRLLKNDENFIFHAITKAHNLSNELLDIVYSFQNEYLDEDDMEL